MHIYKIEDVAKECGLTKRTIRYYEEIGLLFPSERSENGYRLYSEKHIQRLKQIVNARDVLGISLQDLQEYVSIMEEFGLHRQGYQEIQDEEKKLEKLTEMERIFAKLLHIIDDKMAKLTSLRQETFERQQKVVAAKQRIKQRRE